MVKVRNGALQVTMMTPILQGEKDLLFSGGGATLIDVGSVSLLVWKNLPAEWPGGYTSERSKKWRERT